MHELVTIDTDFIHARFNYETCRVLFQNKINLRYCATGWFYYRNILRCAALLTLNLPFDFFFFQMAYGMTEISIILISKPEEDFEHTLDTVGYVADHVEVSNGITYGSKRHYKRPFCNAGR